MGEDKIVKFQEEKRRKQNRVEKPKAKTKEEIFEEEIERFEEEERQEKIKRRKRTAFVAGLTLSGTAALMGASKIKEVERERQYKEYMQTEVVRDELFDQITNMYNSWYVEDEKEDFKEIGVEDIATVQLNEEQYSHLIGDGKFEFNPEEIKDAYLLLDTENESIISGMLEYYMNGGTTYRECTYDKSINMAGTYYKPTDFSFILHGEEDKKYYDVLKTDYEKLVREASSYSKTLKSKKDILKFAKQIFCDRYNEKHDKKFVPEQLKILKSKVYGFEVNFPWGKETHKSPLNKKGEVIDKIGNAMETLTDYALDLYKNPYDLEDIQEGIKEYIKSDPLIYYTTEKINEYTQQKDREDGYSR